MWDSASRAVQDDIKAWQYEKRGSGNEVVGGWKITMSSSPSYFSRYVSDRLAASVLSSQGDRH